MKSRNTLSYADMYRLCNWLTANQAEVENRTRPEISDIVNQRSGLPFVVCESNITAAARVLGVQWLQARVPIAPHPEPLEARVEELETRANVSSVNLASLLRRVARLEEHVATLINARISG